jgi:hypothetical protein
MRPLIIGILSVLLLSNQALAADYKKDFNKALKEIKKENYSEAIDLLKAAQKEKTHSKIAFWLSYSFAQLDNKDLSQSYAQLALEYEPELSEVYKDRINQIIDWCKSTGQTSRSGRFPASNGPPYFEIEKSDKIK